MKRCPYCVSSIDDRARVCHVCQQPLSLRGRALKWMPFFSLLLAVPSVWIGVQQYVPAERAEQSREDAVEQRDVARLETRAEREFNDVLMQEIPSSTKDKLLKDLKRKQLHVNDLEARLKTNPTDLSARKKLIMLRRLR